MSAAGRAQASGNGRGTAALHRRLRHGLRLRAGDAGGHEAELPFRHRHRALGEVHLHRLALAPCRLRLSSEGGPCLALPLAGEATVRAERRGSRPLSADAGHTAVLLPPGAFQLRCESTHEAVLISLPRRPLLDAALALLPPAAPADRRTRLEAGLERGWQWRESEAPAGALLGLLRQTVDLLETAAMPGDTNPPSAGAALQDWILRPLGLLLARAAHEPHQTAPPPQARFEALLAHIEANLHRPLTLGDLCDHSGCSPRTLQYRFERQCGCGPMQWVRRRRLEAAASALRAEGGEPVAAIARRCGYTNLSGFSRDIQRAFGQPPTRLRHAAQARGSAQ